MEKRLILALCLSFLVLTVWNLYLRPHTPPPSAPPQVTAPAAQPQPNAPAPQDTRPVIGETIGESEQRTLELKVGAPGQIGSYHALFSNRGARLVQLELGNFYDRVGLNDAEKLDVSHWTSLLDSVANGTERTGSMVLRSDASARDLEREPLEHALWRMREIEGGVEFDLAQGSGVHLTKRIRFEPQSYRLRVELEVENTGLEGTRRIGYLFCPAEVVPLEAQDRFYVEPQAIAAGRTREQADKKLKLPVSKSIPRDDRGATPAGSFEIPGDEVSFAGVHNKYFACLMHGADPFSTASITGARWRRLRDEEFAKSNPDKADKAWKFMATDVVLSLDVPAKGERKSYAYVVYAGPKDPGPMLSDSADYEALLNTDLGSFCGLPMSSVGSVLLWVLRLFHRLVGNWGIAIILLTICVRAALFPVNRRSQTAMARFQKKMKRIQPQIDELKKRYADDAAKQREEQQKLMGREGLVPPLGGCLPMFVQVPIFFGLFSALRTAFELRQAPFALWITDLSKPDRLLQIDWHIPWIGTTIPWFNLLPILMVVLWVLQQRLMPSPADEQAARMQKMMMFMPVVMGFFLYDYAAGLSVYMITQSTLGILEQSVIKRMWPVDDSEPAKGTDKKSWYQRLMERAQEAQKHQDRRRRGGGAAATGGGRNKKR